MSTAGLPVLTLDTLNEVISFPVSADALENWLQELDVENPVLADCLRVYQGAIAVTDQVDFWIGAAAMYKLLSAQAIADAVPAVLVKRS